VETVARDSSALSVSRRGPLWNEHHLRQLSRKLAQEHAQRGSGTWRPPYSPSRGGGGEEALIVPAGEREAMQRCQPLFDALGRGRFRWAEVPEHASLTKLCGNFVIASLIEMFGEAFVVGEKAGVDPSRLAETLVKILFAGAPIPSGYASRVARTDFEPAGFAMALGLKDVPLA